jgi:hypothetical protein
MAAKKTISKAKSKGKASAKGDTLGGQVDAVMRIDGRIDALMAQVNALKKSREAMVVALMDNFTAQQVSQAKGSLGLAYVNETKHPQCTDWAAFEGYVYKYKAFDMFQRRITGKAYFDRVEAGEQIPGVEVFTKVDLRFRSNKGGVRDGY